MALPRFDLRKLTVTAAWLVADGLTIRLATVGRGYVGAETRLALSPGPATIIVEIDGREYRRDVRIVKGCTAEDRFVDVKDVE